VGEKVGKGEHGRVNIMQILCTHMCKLDMLKLFQEWEEGGIKENDGGG
jgi:hypothetical protein